MTNYFAKNIKYFRNKRHIDQQRMAEDLDISQSTLSCWEIGLRTPNLDMISKISKYLNIYEDYITKDLTIEDNELSLNETYFNNNKDILTESDWNIINAIIEQRKKEIKKGDKNEKSN